MVPQSTLKFLKDLTKNNNKAWFDGHRTEYDAARASQLSLVEQLIKELSKFDPPLSVLSPKECIFRINRDVRFSKDKSPYKTNLGSYFNKGGKKSNGAGYYLHIEPGNSFAAGGMWMPLPADLNKIRQEIDYNFDEWKKLTGSAAFNKQFPAGVSADATLSRPPKGYDENNPAIHYIKMKSFIVSKPIADAVLLDKNAVKEIIAAFKAMKPLVDFLNKAVD